MTIVCKNGESVTTESFDLTISVSPNPTASTFNIQFESNSTDAVVINVFNVLGEKIYSATTLPSSNLIFGNEFPTGVYFVKALQGNNEKVIKN